MATPPRAQLPLLETPETEKPPVTEGPFGKGGPPASRPYQEWVPDQAELLPARVREVLGEGHLACFFVDLRSVLKFDAVLASEKSDTGRPGYHPVTTGLVGHHFHRNHRDPGPGHICPVRPSSLPGKQCLG